MTTQTVLVFNAAISARDLDGLTALMTADHAFTDTEGATIRGRRVCRDAWAGFFAAFPDYRNEISAIHARGNRVVAEGCSRCSEPALAGPALWEAGVRDGLVASWRVYEDTPQNRAALGR